jgi:AcrR family transcriptional regulator
MVGRQSQDATRESLLGSATEVFAARGFSGARVDEIARRAKANKAMIYYHFRSKEGLYKAVLLRQIGGIHREIGSAIEAERDPLKRLQRLYLTLGEAFQARSALPFIMVREILDGGAHMDKEVARAFRGIVDLVRASLEQGTTEGRMRAVNPVFLHFMMIAPLIIFNVSRPFRERFLPVAAPAVDPITPEVFKAQLEDALLRLVGPRPPASVRAKRRKR